ncbi:MAG TPA: helix-turn-helix transcriptional regulator [Metabacillus sp.]|nr:helix-turn-helix transcriptional regulator [Metabacillus sp.]
MIKVKSNLQSILDERGLSVLKVSKDIGYRYESVRQLYNDESKTFPRELLSKLCRYLSVTPGEILVIEKEQTD